MLKNDTQTARVNFFEARRRERSIVPMLENSDVGSRLFVEIAQKHETKRRELLAELRIAEKQNTSNLSAAAKAVQAAVDAERAADHALGRSREALNVAWQHSIALTHGHNKLIDGARVELARLSDLRIGSTLDFCEAIDDRVRNEVATWPLTDASPHARGRRYASNISEVVAAREKLAMLKEKLRAMLVADYGSTIIDTLKKIIDEALAAVKPFDIKLPDDPDLTEWCAYEHDTRAAGHDRDGAVLAASG